jgi:histidine triad (HIT) family protein
MTDCIFCKIVKKEIPAEIVYEDEDIIAFNDINPKAPLHILLIPKKHIADLTKLTENDKDLIGKLHLVAIKLAEEKGVAEKGFRLVNNCKEDGGQEVFHLHYHLLGGKKLPLYT